MKLKSLHLNNYSNSKKDISFSGLNVTKILNSKHIEGISKCNFDNLLGKFTKKAGVDIIEMAKDGVKLIRPKNGVLTQLIELPKDIGLYFSKKLHIKSNYLSKYALTKEQKAYQRAANGFYECGEKFITEALGDKKVVEACKDSVCNGDFDNVCQNVTKKFFKQLNDDFKPENSHYNTRDERTLVKFFTGLVAASFLFLDYHNNAARDGKLENTDKKTRSVDKEAKEKFGQEMKETTGETVAQFLTLGAFSRFTNNSTFAAPILNTATSLIFRITSRLSSHKPLTRIDTPDKPKTKVISINEFINATKENKDINLIKVANEKPKEKKKHLLSLKNIMIALGASITGGFVLRYNGSKMTSFVKKQADKIKERPLIQGVRAKLNKNKKFTKLTDFIKSMPQKYHSSIVGEVEVSQEELRLFYKNLRETDNADVVKYFKNLFDDIFANSNSSKITLGEYEKMTHIPLTKIQVSKRELYQGLLTPIKIVKDLVTYPYTLASSALEKLKLIKEVEPKKFKLKDEFNFVNILQDFRSQKEKFNGKPEKEFIEFYKNHLEKHWVNALNKQTRSNVDNADIGKLTQILGTATSIYFATTDDYNRTVRQTGDKEQAGKDSRSRGLNKFFRIISQISLIDFFNHTFKISYGKSLFGATAISSVCTVATEAMSHVLSGMPLKQLNSKKEYDEYHDKHKNGAYYKLIDKLTD